MQLKRQCQYAPVDLHFNERVKDLDKFVNVDRLKKDLVKNASFNMIWKIKVQLSIMMLKQRIEMEPNLHLLLG